MHSEGSKSRHTASESTAQSERNEVFDSQWAVRELVLRSPVSMALVNSKGRVLAVSIEFRQLFGVPDQMDLTGLSVFDDEASERHGTSRLFRLALDGEVVDFHDLEFLSPFGNFTVTSGRIFPLRDAEGYVRFAVIVHKPDVPRSEATQSLERQKIKSLATLFGRGSQRVTEQISTLHKLLELARRAHRDGRSDTMAEIIDEALGVTGQTMKLTSSVLDLADKTTHTETPVHLGDLVTEVAADYRQASTHLTTHVDSDLWNCHCDRTQMAAALSSILDNAVLSGETTRQVRIFVQNISLDETPDLPEGNYVVIRIEDDGPGLDPDVLPHVFDPYFTTKPNAAGLGLTMARAIVQSHGGRIWMESLAHHGARVHVLLPADPTLSADPSPPAGGQVQMPLRILIMDDNPSVRRVLVRMFESVGCLVDSVADGRDAVRMVSTAARLGRQYALIILDVTVPDGMGGTEAMEQILEISSDVLVVATSGHVSQESLANYEKLGFAGVLAKPFKMAEVEGILDRFVYGRLIRKQQR